MIVQESIDETNRCLRGHSIPWTLKKWPSRPPHRGHCIEGGHRLQPYPFIDGTRTDRRPHARWVFFIRQKGSHQRYGHADGRRIAAAPDGGGHTFAIKTLKAMTEIQARWTESYLVRLGFEEVTGQVKRESDVLRLRQDTVHYISRDAGETRIQPLILHREALVIDAE